ncbi:asparaginase domain-containing protein [Roseivirga sp. E12]|uniref:asparaginase domain-containing protein n=1 Tax=Roseivirga sp. E12 TaxID=2819237 RepID=UPI001ABD2A3C|nr:asparaginase domain-containing protein [Roseivirga sp. E12]MBO3699779.1 asparaginase [Roseivirga sp. E12]
MKILFIQTGGTIDKDYPKTNVGYAFEIDEPAVSRILEKSFPGFEFEVTSLFKKDSMDMTNDDRKELKSLLLTTEYSKIVVTHGSDTMIQTAQLIGNVKDKTILFTGSYRPQRFAESDADFNIGVAVGALNVLTEGTFIAMNGKVMQPETCYKHPKTGLFETE